MAIADPRDIPGLVLWLSADAVTGKANGDTMTTWTDLSPNGNNGTFGTGWTYATTGGSAGGSGKNLVSTGASPITLPNSIMTGKAAGEVFAGVNIISTTNGGLWDLSPGGGSGNHYVFTGNGWYENFGLNTRQQVNSQPPAWTNAWRRLNVWSAPSDFSAKSDDGLTNFSTTGAGAVTWNASTSRLMTTNTGLVAKGSVGYYVLYGRKLTTAERTDLNAWLAANPSGGVQSTAAPTDAPVFTSITTTSTSASFVWSRVQSAPTYEYRINGGTPVSVSGNSNVSLTGLTLGTTYTIEVRGTNGSNAGPWSVATQFTPGSIAPAENFDTDPIAGGRVTLNGGGTWTWENNRLHQQDTGTASKHLFLSSISRTTQVDYEFDYNIVSDPSGRLHSGAFIQTVDDSQAIGFRVTHLDSSYLFEPFLTNNTGNGTATSTVTSVNNPGIVPGRWYRWRVQHDFSTGTGSLSQDGVTCITWTTTSFVGGAGRPGFHTYGSQFDIDNVAYGVQQIPPQRTPTNLYTQGGPGSIGYSFDPSREASSYEYRLNGGTPVAGSYHGKITGLTDGMAYSVQFRLVNSFGPGPWSTAVNVTPSTTPYEALVMVKSPVMFVRFDENPAADWMIDFGSNAVDWRLNHHARLGQSALTTEPGKSAAVGPGVARYPFNLGQVPVPALMATSPQTVECWVAIPPGNQGGYFFSFGRDGGWAVGIGNGSTMDSAGRTLMMVQENVAWKSTGYNFADDGVSTVVYHVAVTRAPGDAFTVYVNGVQINTQTWTPNAYTAIQHSVSVGGPSRADIGTRGLPTTVKLDQFAAYSTVHASSEIFSRYQAGVEINTTPPAVTGLKYTPITDGALVFWDKPVNVNKWEWRIAGQDATITPVTTNKATITSYLTNSVTTSIEVRATSVYSGPGPWTAISVTPKIAYLVDDFERNNDATSVGSPVFGGPYRVDSGTFGITSGMLYNPGGNTENVLTFPADSDVDMKAVFGAAGTNQGLIARFKDTSNYWLFQNAASQYNIHRKVAGTFVLQRSLALPAWVAGDEMRVVAYGKFFYLFKNGKLFTTFEDNFYDVTATRAGVRMASDTSQRFRDLFALSVTPSDVSAVVLPAAVADFTGLETDHQTPSFVYKGRDRKIDDTGSVA